MRIKKFLIEVHLLKKKDYGSEITEIENKIPSISSLATNSALSTVENKIPDVSSLVKKTDFDTKLKKISDRVASNKSKHLLEKFDAAYFRGKNYFEGDGTQNYLVFQPM